MPGLMQNDPINLISILQHAARWHPKQEIVTNSVEGGIHRETYSEAYERAGRLANALKKMGVKRGDRIATMGWNTWRHLESWYAIMGMGAICHTLNPRLSSEQLEYIVNHAEDRILLVDITFVPIIAAHASKLPTLEAVIVMTDDEHMPEFNADLPVYSYESLISGESSDFDWAVIPEDEPSSLCYTSGTTGDPKGVQYTHRSNLLHAYATCSPETFDMDRNDSFLMIVPMFHANSWGLGFSLPLMGTKAVMPGPHMDGENVYKLIVGEQVTRSAAVPTVWSMLLDYLNKNELQIPTLKETTIGGSAVPRSMIVEFEEKYGVDVLHAWGMTETSPLGTYNRAKSFTDVIGSEKLLDYRCKQGRPIFGVDIKIVDDDGNALPHDGEADGRLLVKGPWVIERYYKQDTTALENGWLDTGDIASIDELGFMQITDRAKDVIKSGGEWISSVDVENAAVAHPGVSIAACIGVRHAKWEERPLLIVQKQPDATVTDSEIMELLAETFAKWQLPDAIVYVDAIPLTATGKVDKKPLRTEYMDYLIENSA